MKVVILAGGFGSRISEYTESIPKPMIMIGGKPIIWHIMNYYASFGHNDFYIALGYKAYKIKEFFLNYTSLNSDFTVNLSTGEAVPIQKKTLDWKVTLVDTGLNSMTGGRIKKLKKYLVDDNFLLTYGDGLSDVNINNLIEFHKKNNKLITVTAVHPIARFGELDINSKGNVLNFKEKPQTFNGWINGGYFVVKREFIDLIDNDQTILEKDPLEKAVQMKQLSAFKHEGFWQCMDTKRDKDKLEEIYKSKFVPWLNSG